MNERQQWMDSLTLEELVQQFRDGGYPDEHAARHQEARAEYERVLRSLPEMSYERRDELRSVWKRNRNGYDYGGVGITAALDGAIRDVSPSDWPTMRDRVRALCDSRDDVVARFDEAMSDIKGLGPLMATRFLAIMQSARFMPNYLTRSSNSQRPGKVDALELLLQLELLDAPMAQAAQALVESPRNATRSGQLAVRSNDLLLDALHPYFSADDSVDTWGMARFLYWLAERFADGEDEPDDDDDESDDSREHLAVALGAASEDLLCGVEFLNDVVGLLEDKGQVILYGPPGTGKTYFAQRLAQALAGGVGIGESAEGTPDATGSEAFTLVQFHPAYSYEDFFEGFRPAVDDDGNMTYRLTPGPLMRIAEIARANPGQRHVMVIDEINRANLPRVLGELLFLLEYRNRDIHTQYRSDAKFSLPKNLWFIGTMNTADRSIALLDAAMRRRFHFVPFFPDREPTAGLLREWCGQKASRPAWVADLLDGVNQQLRDDLRGDHLLIGPSHFMKEELDKNSLRRIWKYNIEPLIEDQFFGQQDVINRFRFEQVWERHGPKATARESETGTPDVAVEDAESMTTSDEHSAGHGGE